VSELYLLIKSLINTKIHRYT